MNVQQKPYIALIAGSRWENTQGTDHRLALALAIHHNVLWVDPPVPFVGPAVVDRPPVRLGTHMDRISNGIFRLRVLVPPGPSRVGLRQLAAVLSWRAIRRTQRKLGVQPVVTLALSPSVRLPKSGGGIRALHVTDDWVAGAELMGLSRRYVERVLHHNLRVADIVTAVTPHLAATLQEFAVRTDVGVLPNGCERVAHLQAGDHRERRPAVGLLGQLNERLDFDLLDRVADTGIPIDVIGPRRDHDADTARRLDEFLGRANVVWFGEVASAEVPRLLDRVTVGITPYATNEFNRASFPLKTLEYLSAGLPVVATDSPAVRWLDTGLITVGRTDEEFVASVIQLAHQQLGEEERSRNQGFAQLHSWSARAEQLMQMAESVRSVWRASGPAKDPAKCVPGQCK